MKTYFSYGLTVPYQSGYGSHLITVEVVGDIDPDDNENFEVESITQIGTGRTFTGADLQREQLEALEAFGLETYHLLNS